MIKLVGRKIICIVFVIFLLFSSFSICLAAQNELFIGDVNNDGTVNTADAVCILRYCVNFQELDFLKRIAADVTSDGEINTGDVSMLLKCLITDNDYLQPAEIIGDLDIPVFYADIEYTSFTKSNDACNIFLSQYTSYAVKAPSGTVAYGQGYTVNLKQGKSYVFETIKLDGQSSPDTVLYLLDSNNNAFMTDDDSGDGKLSRIEYNSWETASYKILVTGKDSDQTGSCRLNIDEHVYISSSTTPEPTEVPTVKPTATPTPKPTETPQPTLSPTPSSSPVTGITFINQTVPIGGDVVQYKSAHSLKGTIVSDEKYITSVDAVIYNANGVKEAEATKSFSLDLEIVRYSLTDGGSTSIDGQISFKDLTIGTKKIILSCKINGEKEKKLIESYFYVGATDNLLKGNAFSGSAQLSTGIRNTILEYLNGLDEKSIRTKAIMESFTYLGVEYGADLPKLDCSLIVQIALKDCGIGIPRTSSAQAEYCYDKNGIIPESERKPGDLVFFNKIGCHCGRFHEIHHVAIYIGKVNGIHYFIEASSRLNSIVLRKAWGDDSTDGLAVDFYSHPYDI